MKLSVPGVKDHQSDKNDHVGKAIEGGIQKAAKSRDSARKPRHLPVQHVKKIGNDQNNPGPEKLAVAEEQSGANIYGNPDDGQDVWIDVAVREPTHHRVDNSLSPAANATYKHFLFEFSLGHYAEKFC